MPCRDYASPVLQIAIIADYDPSLPSHEATDAAIQHAAHKVGVNYSVEWFPTDTLERNIETRLRYARGILIGPGSPYVSMQGALNAIRLARETGRPLLGTCGGFQHIVLEYARNVLGVTDARHAEYEPTAKQAIVRALPCSLAGKTLSVDLAEGSLARRVYGRARIEETYHCSFGLDPAYRVQLEAAGLRVTGVEAAGDGAAAAGTESLGAARILELMSHPFYVGTLFEPQMRSTRATPHPVIEAFVRATIESKVPIEEQPIFVEDDGEEGGVEL